MKSALVLGATGHIGSHIVRELLKSGYRVRCAYRNPQYLYLLESLPVEICRVDLESLEGLRDALTGCKLIFHAAGYYPDFTADRDSSVAMGRSLTVKLFEEFERAQPERVVFTSSASTLPRIEHRQATENDFMQWPPPPDYPVYATVKLAMEQEALNACRRGLPVVVTNPSVCIGEYDAHSFSGQSVLAFARKKLPAVTQHRFNVIYTGDVGRGHVLAAEKGRLGERYILSNEDVVLEDWARLVASKAGVAPPRFKVPHSIAWLAACVSEAGCFMLRKKPLLTRQAVSFGRRGQRLNGEKARAELGLELTPIEIAVERSIEWFRQNGYLSAAKTN